MTKLHQIYRCPICGNVVEVLHTGVGQLVCCGQPMDLFESKTEDVGFEKHIPVIEKTSTGITVKVGSIPHPMEEAHFIEWIEVISNDQVFKKFLQPNQPAQASFDLTSDNLQVRAYCNIHGLWGK